MLQTSRTKILQIVPALPEWEAIFVNDHDELIRDPVICWAHIQMVFEGGEKETSVIGMISDEPNSIGSLALVGTLPGFLGYAFPDCQTDWLERMEAYLASKRGETERDIIEL